MVVSSNAGTISGLSQGAYDNITVSQAGCTSVDDIDVSLSDPTSVTIAIANNTDPATCSASDGSIELSGLATSTSYSVSYILDGGTPVVSTLSSDVSGQLIIGGLTAGSYTSINVTNAGCTSNSLSQTLTDPAIPTLAITSSTDPTTCLGTDGSIVLATTDLSDGSYTVAYAGGTLPMVVSSNQGTISNLPAGDYNDITITELGCTSVANIDVTLTDPAIPTLAITSSTDPTTCLGTDGSIVLATTDLSDGSYTVAYAGGTLPMVVSSNQGTISNLPAGDYNAITITELGCTSVEVINITLTDPAIPTLAITSSTDPTTCLGTDGSIVLATTDSSRW